VAQSRLRHDRVATVTAAARRPGAAGAAESESKLQGPPNPAGPGRPGPGFIGIPADADSDRGLKTGDNVKRIT
jgi:hypothetical protein